MERSNIQQKEGPSLKPLLTVLCSMLILVPMIEVALADNWTVDLISISMTSEDNGWIVGMKGTILHWNGNSWDSHDSPTSAGLAGIDMLNAWEGWAIGDRTILHWKDGQWLEEEIYGLTVAPDTRTYSISLNSISMVDSDNGWIVGSWVRQSTLPEDYSFSESGIMLKWDGTKWSVFNSFGSIRPLGDVSIVNVNTGWALGEGHVFRWNGVSWSDVYSASGACRIFAVSASDVWITALNTPVCLHHWNGASWTAMGPLTDTQGNWFNAYPVFFNAADSGWTAGSYSEGEEMAIYHWNGADWQKQTSFQGAAGKFSLRLTDIYMQSDTSGWAIGDEGTILRWDGSAWNVYASSYWPSPFWSQWWFWVVVALVVVVVIGSIVLIKRKVGQKVTSESNRAPG
jgi:hypothetical protein